MSCASRSTGPPQLSINTSVLVQLAACLEGRQRKGLAARHRRMPGVAGHPWSPQVKLRYRLRLLAPPRPLGRIVAAGRLSPAAYQSGRVLRFVVGRVGPVGRLFIDAAFSQCRELRVRGLFLVEGLLQKTCRL